MYLSAQEPGANPFGTTWTSGTINNQIFYGGKASFTVKPIFSYRGAMRGDVDARAIADDNFMTKALSGPASPSPAVTPANISFVYVVPSYSTALDPAQEFLLHLTANYGEAIFNTELCNHPSYPATAPQQGAWLDSDPFGSTPVSKLSVLKDAAVWNTNLGYPGADNPAIAEVYFTFIMPRMFANAAKGTMTAAQAVADAEAKINIIYSKWRGRGLI